MPPHGLINYTDATAFVDFESVCGTETSSCQGVVGWLKTARQITVYYSCALSSMYIIRQWVP